MSSEGKSLLNTVEDDFDEWRKRKAAARQSDWLEDTARTWETSPAALRWFALVPFWTAKLAFFVNVEIWPNTVASSDEATQKLEYLTAEAARALLEKLSTRGLFDTQIMPVIMPTSLDDGRLHREQIFQLDEKERKAILNYLREKEGQNGLVNEMTACARRVAEAQNIIELPENLLIWAQLARYLNEPPRLLNLIEEAVTQATPAVFSEKAETALTELDTEQKILAISNLPSPTSSPTIPSAYFNCVEFGPEGKIRREWNTPINSLSFSIGRTFRNSLVLNDPRISRAHAVVRWQGDAFYITDSQSRNGLYAGNYKLVVDEPYRMEDGATVDVGAPDLYRLALHLQPLENNSPAPPAREISSLAASYVENEQTTRPVKLPQDWLNPVQAGPGANAETVHLPTLEANLNRALQWVDNGRQLTEYLDPAGRVRIDRASARLQLQFRRWDDLQQLKTFLERREQIRAFEALISGPNDNWALHYIGPGGFGKTTLIRYIVTRLAPARNIPVGRLDFDHLDPRYPRYQPGLLLQALAEELRLQAPQPYTFSGFDQSLAAFYEKYPPQEAGLAEGEGHDWLNNPLFKKLMADFAAALKEMGGQVLLVLDTCEELTRIRLAGQPAESVSITFGLLEKLHELEPNLRVIFCGRRPLASAGNGWKLKNSSTTEDSSEALTAEAAASPEQSESPKLKAQNSKLESSLAPRPYLALFPVLGFSREEAEAYLEAAGIEKEFWEAVIDKTTMPAPALYGQFEWNAQDQIFVRTQSEERANPFDMALYADWVQDDPDITPEKVAETDFQRYVETRILGRARSELSQGTLMAVAMLGQFDYALLRATLEQEVDSKGPNWKADQSEISPPLQNFDQLYQALGAYEWVIHGSNGWIGVQDNILERMRDYYARQRNANKTLSRQWGRMRVQALRYLEDRTMNDAHLSGSFTAAEVALRLHVEENPGKAFDWFSRLNRALVSWDWAQLLTERLLTVPLDDRPASDLMLARILLLQGAARLHQFRGADLRELWKRTAEYVAEVQFGLNQTVPDSYERTSAFNTRLEFVRLAALGGQAAAYFVAGETLPEERWLEFWDAVQTTAPVGQPREFGGLIGAIEAAVEARENERLARPLPLEILEVLYKKLNSPWRWKNSTIQPRLLAAYVQSLWGRALFFEGRTSEGLQQLDAAATAGRKLGTLLPPFGIANQIISTILPNAESQALSQASMVNRQSAIAVPRLDINWTYLWDAPEDICSRLQLEWGRLARSRLPLRLVANHLPLPDKLPFPATLEQDKLLGLEILLSDDLRPATDRRLPELLGLLVEPPTYSLVPEGNAHRALLSVRVAAAKALSGVGRFGEAIAELEKFISGAEEQNITFTSSPETQALVELATAARLGAGSVRRFDNLLSSNDTELLRLAWGLQALEGRRQPMVTGWSEPNCLPIQAHNRWRGGYALRRDYAQNLIEVYQDMANRARKITPPRTPAGRLRYDFELYQLKLDDLEVELMRRRLALVQPINSLPDPGPPSFGKAGENGLRLNHQLLALARYRALKSQGEELIIPSDMLARLGERYAARLLLEDGELLALRLPAQAVYMLAAARSLFLGSRESDPLSAAYAGIVETLALTRSGKSDRARVVWREVQNAYERFRANWPNLSASLGLPDWKSLEKAYQNPSDRSYVLSLFSRLDTYWRGWLTRLIFTGIALQEDPDLWLAARQSLNSVLYASAEKEGGLNLLPAELDGLIEESISLDFAPNATRSGVGGGFKTYLPAVFSRKTTPKLEISAVALPSVSPLQTYEPLNVKLRDSSRTSEIGSIETTLTYRPWQQLRHTEGDPAQNQISKSGTPVSWRRVVEKIVEVRRKSHRSRGVPVLLQVQEGVSFLPWEALSFGKEAIALQPGVALRRITKSWEQRPREVSGRDILLICDPGLDELRQAFAALLEKGLMDETYRLDLESLANPALLKNRPLPPRLVHLIGRSLLVSDTPRLAISRRRSSYISQSMFNMQTPNSKSSESNYGKEKSVTLAGRDLANLFPAARLVIIQAQPVEDADWNSDSSYQAAYLRLIAEEMFKAGVPAALSVPPMTLADGRRFLAALTRRLSEIDWKRNAENGLVEAVSEARRDLARFGEQTIRSALDLCLYADNGSRLNLID